MAFELTYQDYLRALPQGSEAGGNGAFDEDTWRTWTNQQKLANGGAAGIAINPTDPRYGLLQQTTGGPGTHAINVGGGPMSLTNDNNVTNWNDPSKVYQGNGMHAFLNSNVTPEATASGDDGLSDKGWGILAATLLGGGALAGGMLGGAASGGAMATEVGGGFGTGALGSGGTGAAFSGAGGAYGSAGAALGGAGSGGYDFSQMPQMEPTHVGNLGSDGLLGNTPYDFSTMQPLQPTQVGNLGPGFNGNPSMLNNLMQGNFSDAAGQAGKWAMNNPMQAYGLGQTAVGLFQGNGGGSSGGGGSGSKSAGGGGLDLSKLARPQFQQNPYLAAQLHRGGYQ
jgi:hypothetical protein